MKIITFPHDQIPPELLDDIDSLYAEAYGNDSDEQRGDSPTEPPVSEAFQHFVTVDEKGIVVGNLAAYVRAVKHKDQEFQLGMIGDVATRTTHKKQGVAKSLVKAAHMYFAEQSIEFSVLFAYDPPVYKSSGYKMIENEIRFVDGRGEWRTLRIKGSMFCELGQAKWPAGEIDLCGPPV